ncbi:MAG: metallopeptidase [Desulfurococcales archaeon]|nr:metallopeptidase [Desulfurococcales archaeon]
MRVDRDVRCERAVKELVRLLNLNHIDPDQVRVVWSHSNSRAVARIWGVNSILREGVGTNVRYVIELVKPLFTSLTCEEKVKTLTHELTHIPHTFSGYVRPHNKWFRRDLRLNMRRLRKVERETLTAICESLSPPT